MLIFVLKTAHFEDLCKWTNQKAIENMNMFSLRITKYKITADYRVEVDPEVGELRVQRDPEQTGLS